MASNSSSLTPAPVVGAGNKATVSTCPAVSPPGKRKLEGITDPSNHGGTNNTSRTMPITTNKKSKLHNSASVACQSSLQALHDRRPEMYITPPESLTPLKRNFGEVDLKKSRTAQKSAVKEYLDDVGFDVQRHKTKRDLDIAQNALLQAEAQIAELKRALAECQGETLKVKQDAMLDRIMQEDVNVKKVFKLKREKNSIEMKADADKKERVEAEQKLAAMTEKYNMAIERAVASAENSDHLQTIVKMLYGDLDALRQLESEEVARRKKQKQGLPPAYQEHRRPDQCAPYEQHKDDGEFNEDKLEEAVKETFDDTLIQAHKDRIKYQKSDNMSLKTKADSVIFTATANALAVACFRLRSVLRSADDMAGWIADFLLELSWIAVSACELRPATIYLTTNEKNRAGLAFWEVDDLLLEALKQDFEDYEPDYELLVYEIQTWLTRTMALQKSFTMLHTRTGYDYFDKTIEWLTERVEFERARQANSS